jgi:cytochrome oxidase assembly protein ShyY1
VIALIAADRQSVIILAFWTLVGAGVVVSLGAWILLRRESRRQRPGQPESETQPEPESEAQPETRAQQNDDVEEPAGT